MSFKKLIEKFKPKTKVILDTNFALLPGSLGIDIFTEIDNLMNVPYELCVLDQTISELETLMTKNNSKHSFNAKLAFLMIKQKNLKTIKGSSSYVDDSIISYINKNTDSIVATQDKELKKRVWNLKGKVIFLKQKKYLELR